MAQSVSKQGKVNPVFQLAIRVGKMGPSCPSGFPALVTQGKKKFSDDSRDLSNKYILILIKFDDAMLLLCKLSTTKSTACSELFCSLLLLSWFVLLKLA